jgi:hypothetical protein
MFVWSVRESHREYDKLLLIALVDYARCNDAAGEDSGCETLKRRESDALLEHV